MIRVTTYEQSERLSNMAAKVIADNDGLKHLSDPNCRIAYQTSNQAKKSNGKIIYADTERVKPKYKVFMPYDFVITFYWPNCENMTEEKLEKLMYHELKHVGFNGDCSFTIIPHDVEDFRDVVGRWGLDWI